jgi:hypothetical protein
LNNFAQLALTETGTDSARRGRMSLSALFTNRRLMLTLLPAGAPSST